MAGKRSYFAVLPAAWAMARRTAPAKSLKTHVPVTARSDENTREKPKNADKASRRSQFSRMQDNAIILTLNGKCGKQESPFAGAGPARWNANMNFTERSQFAERLQRPEPREKPISASGTLV
jgi:hypothetical protein